MSSAGGSHPPRFGEAVTPLSSARDSEQAPNAAPLWPHKPYVSAPLLQRDPRLLCSAQCEPAPLAGPRTNHPTCQEKTDLLLFVSRRKFPNGLDSSLRITSDETAQEWDYAAVFDSIKLRL